MLIFVVERLQHRLKHRRRSGGKEPEKVAEVDFEEERRSREEETNAFSTLRRFSTPFYVADGRTF